MSETERVRSVESDFKRLSAVWIQETALSSAILTDHPAYQKIITLGEPVVPIILDQLAQEPDWWFHALEQITGENPVSADMQGNLMQITDAWLNWGRNKGLIVNDS